MRKTMLATIIAVLAATQVFAQDPEQVFPVPIHDSVLFQGTYREYFMFLPETPAPGKPVMLMLHGHGGNAKDYRPEMSVEALKHGFALCVPMGAKSPANKRSWNVRYNNQKGWEADDVSFICALSDSVAHRYGLNPDNAFLSGMSNGGDIGYIIAYQRPEHFRAIASVAGMTMCWVLEEIKPRGRVPFMEVHGTADKTTYWDGDYDDKGGWGPYISVDEAIERVNRINGCELVDTLAMPLLHPEGDPKGPSRPVTKFTYAAPDGVEVLVYKVYGGKHSWHLADMDTCGEILKFFEQYLKKD